MTDAQMNKYIQQVRKESNVDLEKILKRHVTALAEDFNDKLSGVAEMVGGLMTDMTEVKDTLNVVQSDVEIIKNDLKQKVDRSEFEALVKRVSFVEKKLATR